MLTTILLSVDSMFAGAALRLFGSRTKYRVLACGAMGLADLLALFLGRALHNVISMSVSASQQGILFAGCALIATILGWACARYPKTTIFSIAVLFSIDNLLVGTRLSSFTSATQLAPAVAISSGLACLAGLHFAQAIAVRVRPRVSFALASLAVCLCFFSI
jgi:hypothetical protein